MCMHEHKDGDRQRKRGREGEGEGEREREEGLTERKRESVWQAHVICSHGPFHSSYVSRLVECVDSQLLEYHSAALGKWLAETSSDITMKLSSRCCEHLYVIFKKKGQWNCVVELFASCNRYVHELGARVCEPLATALQQLGPITKLISIAETLTEDQMARMSSEVIPLANGSLLSLC